MPRWMCVHAAALIFVAGGCASVTIQPGHRGVLVDPDALPRPTVLVPGIHRVSSRQSVTDYAVTYARRDIRVEVLARDGTPLHVDLIVVFRPIVAELAQLHVDEGPRYFDDVVAPALTSTARAVLSEALLEESALPRLELLEESLVAAVRAGAAGQHVEIAQVVIARVEMTPAACGHGA